MVLPRLGVGANIGLSLINAELLTRTGPVTGLSSQVAPFVHVLALELPQLSI